MRLKKDGEYRGLMVVSLDGKTFDRLEAECGYAAARLCEYYLGEYMREKCPNCGSDYTAGRLVLLCPYDGERNYDDNDDILQCVDCKFMWKAGKKDEQ